jgi:predicted nucleic acid-binding protein
MSTPATQATALVALDTNLLIYAIDARNPTKRASVLAMLERDQRMVLLYQVATEFIAATRKLPVGAITPQQAWIELGRFRKAMRLVLPSERVLPLAEDLHSNKQVSLWDAMILAACVDAGVERLYSEDLPGRVRGVGVEVVNPFADLAAN